MIGTAPIFYRITVTTALLQALATASYPQEETIVLKFIPPVPNQNRYRIDGMRPLDNRHIILQCFEAFKAVIVRLFCPCLKILPYLICSCRIEWCRSQNTSDRKILVDFVSSNITSSWNPMVNHPTTKVYPFLSIGRVLVHSRCPDATKGAPCKSRDSICSRPRWCARRRASGSWVRVRL
jgi:hypothetical protein